MAEQEPESQRLVRVLLIEDDVFDVELIKAALDAQLRVNLNVVKSEVEFAAELQREGPDIIVSDSKVGGFDSLTALTLAKQKAPETPFVFCSGNEDPQKQADAYKNGAAGWVSKRDSFAQLVAIIRRLCPASGK